MLVIDNGTESRVIRPTRRGLLAGLGSFLAAPAIVRASSLMSVSVQPVYRRVIQLEHVPLQAMTTAEAIERWLVDRLADKMLAFEREQERMRPYPPGIMSQCKVIA